MKFKKDIPEYRCPDLEELVAFVLGLRESSWIAHHLKQCEICEDLAGGIDSFKKEYITEAALCRQLIESDEAYLKTLKLPENHNDLISEIAQKLELPDIIEKRIRNALNSPVEQSSLENRVEKQKKSKDKQKE